eukprot:COSAG01_NODE_36177_length_521_cov_0.791469_2_plen_49_part_01
MTGISLCDACSCHEILRAQGTRAVPLLLLAGAKDEVVPHQQMLDIWASF